ETWPLPGCLPEEDRGVSCDAKAHRRVLVCACPALDGGAPNCNQNAVLETRSERLADWAGKEARDTPPRASGGTPPPSAGSAGDMAGHGSFPHQASRGVPAAA